MARIEKQKRNDKIYAESKRAGGNLSIRELMVKFNLKSPSTVWNILEVVKRRRNKNLL